MAVVLAFPFSGRAHEAGKEHGVLVVSQDAAWPPLAYRDEDGTPRGILIDLWRKFSEVTGRPVEFKLVDWQDSQPHTGMPGLQCALVRSRRRLRDHQVPMGDLDALHQGRAPLVGPS